MQGFVPSCPCGHQRGLRKQQRDPGAHHDSVEMHETRQRRARTGSDVFQQVARIGNEPDQDRREKQRGHKDVNPAVGESSDRIGAGLDTDGFGSRSGHKIS